MIDATRDELRRLVERLAPNDHARAAKLSIIAGRTIDRQRVRTWRLGQIPESAALAVLLVRSVGEDSPPKE